MVRDNGTIVAAWVAAGATVIVALITMMSPPVQDWIKNKIAPAKPASAAGPLNPKKTKRGLCKEDPQSKDPYKIDIPPFYPKDHMVDMVHQYGGDSVNPGHKWQVKVEAPGRVYNATCNHQGTSEDITYCNADSDAKGSPTKIAEITGWINGAGGLTSMTVFYEMPCDLPDDGS